MSRVSVIIPTFNSELTVVKSLESAINQTRQPDEIIVSDNQSTDSTVILVKKVITENPDIPIILVSCSIRGAGPNRNYAVSKSHFELLAFLDADDVWDTNFLMKMTEFRIRQNLIRGAYARYSTKSGMIMGSSIRTKSDHSAKDGMLKSGVMPFLLSSWVMNRFLFDKLNGFDPEFLIAQDFEFFYRHLQHGGELEVMREQLLTYLIHDVSETTTQHFIQRLTTRYVLVREHGKYKNLNEFLELNSSNLHYRIQSTSDILIRQYLTTNSGNKINNLHLLFWAFLLSPIRFLIKIWLQRPHLRSRNFRLGRP
jgi:glycosyltransferase involved in cell wall biosynthesis